MVNTEHEKPKPKPQPQAAAVGAEAGVPAVWVVGVHSLTRVCFEHFHGFLPRLLITGFYLGAMISGGPA